MKIIYSVYKKLMQLYPCVPPEHGGILGGYNGVITEYFHDSCNQDNKFATYIPNITELNQQILYWHENNIEFYGLLHSHPLNEKELSLEDNEYIHRIMYSLPQKNAVLYFPIIFPHNEILVFIAKKNGTEVKIERDVLELI